MPINYKKYPPNWKSEIRPAALERAAHKCEFCGVTDKSLIHRYGPSKSSWIYWPEGMEGEAWTLDGLKATKIVLTIAHMDHDVTNNDPANLKALCQKCHLGYDKTHHLKNASETRRKKLKMNDLF